jgi:hypothetical protein
MTTKGRGRPITKASTLLALTRDSLANGRWCQGALQKRNGAKCLMGHIEYVVDTHKTHITGAAESDAYNVIHDVIAERVGFRLGIPTFNDRKGRKKADVVALLDDSIKVAKRLERQRLVSA